ncbi:para-aminobenzoate synthase component I [Natrinema pellirubrum DSM 15624]|uniref:anthranilate synthase n=1 Tax=Natrinema pellirubrum (strain DSM 15624 / CIP 106293 / JCM 10476 / NCIMB 786 / 157) TaxID=797303 RepID=L0JQD8_NATP1|nr:aminodeoxychorismate synthase, component I [Natrinema pellirubrum]AGB33048.1 aminodeoxychorismate synthase, component I, clade 2 [Natrinema pellirubrum DSM 15624]ELY71929.1 para-aminobenzoate synthase component I [Natrinema pellirubrum DSM 15624]
MSDPRVVTTLDSFRAAACDPEPGASTPRDAPATRTGRRVPVEVRLTVDDPFAAYRRARDGEGDAFLETTGGQPGWGYFGVDPVDRLTVGPDAVPRAEGDSPTLAALEGLLATERLARGDCDVPYPCGAVGWLSYDVARELEALPESAVDDRGLPRLEAAVYDRLAAWEAPVDGETTLRITACPRVGTDDADEAPADDAIESAYERGRERALDLAERIREGDPAVGDPPVSSPEATFESDCGREAFADRVRRVKASVREGDTFQANISQRLVAPAAVHPVAAYDALRRVNPAPYSCLLEFRAAELVSASPELLLARDSEFVRTEPIAGTRPRGETPAEDDALEADLLADEKERAEHAMLVDLERNDLGKVCAYGSVDVSEYRRIDRYSEVMHLVSNVTGRLRPDATLSDAIGAVFPGGTITGAPKPRTMAIIDELEATRRGPYTGSVGIFGFDGRATLNIVIRTLVRQADEYHLRVGAGIVHDSDPQREYDETLDKARALITAVDEALGERAALGLEAESDEANPETAGGGERGD